jgi:uncharacterized hydrophobic protein (TIGR00271 family)
MFDFPTVSSHRARAVVRDIAAGSRAQARFFVLLVAASMIASFGLIASSTAVIIGAMLVSPLMTPIFGVALGMLRGNPRLLWRSLSSELIGIALAVGSAYLVGLPQLTFYAATPEMLTRTQPNLLDLLVAVFAGFAGAYALVDERVSPALPGVAIATAIVPPLSTCGLCLALGAWSGAGGAMLLFLANFVSILLVALLTFRAGGLGRSRRRTAGRIVTQMGPTAVAFIVVAVVLTNSLISIMHSHLLEQGIQSTLAEHLAAKHGASLMEVIHKKTPTGVQVLATVRSQRTISPAWVSAIQTALEESAGSSVDLVVRTIRSRDVCPLGSSLQVVRPNMDGNFLVATSEDDVARETLAAQVIRETFEQEPGFELTRVEYGANLASEGIVVAYVNAMRRFGRDEIGTVEDLLQERLDDPTLRFLMRVNAASLQGRSGPIVTEWTNLGEAGTMQVARLPEIEAALQSAVKQSIDLIHLYTHFHWEDGRWRALVEITGPRLVTVEDVEQVQSALPEEYREEVEVLLWRRSDFVATADGYTTYNRLTDPLIGQRRKRLYELFHTEVAGPKSTSTGAPKIEAPDP